MNALIAIPAEMHPEIEITFEKASECRRKDLQDYNITKYGSYGEMVRAEKAEFKLRMKTSNELY
ncbi:MAG: hypothetical protein KGH60_01295 [Candidatus Micrarchaeota archaeon]|nr:hypothetical protein [Candidatus Micrarchaeota archaeon]